MKVLELLKRQVQVARVYGIPVRIDYRWFPVSLAILWLVAVNLPAVGVRAGMGARLVLSFVTTVMLFLSIFGHELAHALMARAEGIKTLEIVLHPFGGLARLERAPDTARAEFRIAVAGPAASFLFALGCFIVREATFYGGYRTATGIFYLIAWWNFLLAFFNLLPGYPLDGGRILRAILWHRTGNLTEATRITSLGGQVIAWTLVVIGAYITLVWQDLLLGVWSIVVGLFLRDAAVSVLREAGIAGGGSMLGNFGRRTVGEAMMQPHAIAPDMLVSQFVDTALPVHRRTRMLVARDNRLHGILSLEDLKALPRERWARTPVRDVMRVVSENLFVDARLPLAEAEELMKTNGAGALGVVNRAGELVGFLQRIEVRD